MKWNLGVMVLVIILFISFVGAPLTVSANELTENNDSHIADPPWPCFGGNAARTGLSPYDTSHVNGTSGWRTELGLFFKSSPVIGMDGTIYIGTSHNHLYAIDSEGGVKWSFEANDNIGSTPAIDKNGTIYVGSWDSNLYAINPDGTEKWRFETGWRVESSPVIGDNGTIYFGSGDFNLYALNPDGTLKWSFETIYMVSAAPAIGQDGTIYVVSEIRDIHALNPDGTLKWTYSLEGKGFFSSPVVDSKGTIYVPSLDNKIYAFNPDGSLKWSYTTGDSIWSSPAIGPDDTVYVGSNDNNVYAINPDGTLKWSHTTSAEIRWSSPAIDSNGIVYVGSNDGKIYAINSDGTTRWIFRTNGRIWSSPAIGEDGTIYVASSDRYLYAFGVGERIQLEEEKDYDQLILTIYLMFFFGFGAVMLVYKIKKHYKYFSKIGSSKPFYDSIKSSADARFIIPGILLFAIGIYLYFYDLPITAGLPPYPYREKGMLMMFLSGLITLIGCITKKKNTPTPPPTFFGPNMNICRKCNMRAVKVERDNSAYCKNCGHAYLDYHSEVVHQRSPDIDE